MSREQTADFGDERAAALRQSEERYRMLAENVQDVIWATDAKGQFTYVSPSVERLSGYTPEETMRQTMDDMLTPASARTVRERVRASLRMATAGQPIETQRIECEQNCRDGTTVWIEVNSAPLYDASGEFAGVVGVSRDISERRAMELEIRRLNTTLEQQVEERTTQLRAAVAELERAGRMKDEFLAAVSHELRTPLAGVLSLAEVLELQINGPLNERQVHYVQSIQQSGKRLLAMINGILHYTSLMAGNVNVQQEPCRLAELCAVGVRAVRERAEQKGQTLVCSVEPAGLVIRSDAEGITRMLQHLLDNAVKFTPEGGQIGLEVRGDAGAESVRLVVWDTGIGIAAEQQTTIFRPFVQGDGSLARHYEGVGLGLAYVQRMVELLGGTVTVESALGEGSRFTVTLPNRGLKGF